MTLIDDLLKKYNIKDFNALTPDERSTLLQMVNEVKKAEITIPAMKEKMRSLIDNLNMELTKEEAPKDIWTWLFRSRADIALKARLRSYTVIYNILAQPERAEAMLKKSLENLK